MHEPTSDTPPNDASSTNAPSHQPPRARLCRLSDALSDFRADATAAHDARKSGRPRGPQTGFKELDRELNGALSPGLHMMHGNSGAGKTALALQMAAGCATLEGFPVLFVTCEMAVSEMLRRLTANITDTYLGRLKSGEMTPADAEALAMRAIEAAPQLAFVDATQAAASQAFLIECAHIVKGDARHLLIVIDSLHTWTQTIAATESTLSEYEALNYGIRALQLLAAQLRAPVLIVSEQNRDSMKNGGLNAGAGSRKIEYQAETVFDLNCDKSKTSARNESEVTLKIQKNRHGASGHEMKLWFHGATQKFREVNGWGAQ